MNNLLHSLRRGLRRLHVEQTGASAMTIAIGLTSLMGMTALVVDVGLLAHAKREVQTAADAAALAGAPALPDLPNLAISTATDYAQTNGRTGDTIQTAIVTSFYPGDSIQVTVSRTVSFTFAGVLGFQEGAVSASATAVIGSLAGAQNVMPFGVVCPAPPCFSFGDQTELKMIQGSQGNWGPIRPDPSDSGAADYKDNIVNGSSSTVTIGQWLNPENGAMTGPTRQGIEQRLDGNTQGLYDVVSQPDASGHYQVLDRNSPRLVIIPFINDFGNGQSAVQVTGFGLFYLDGLGSGASVWGTFVDSFIPGEFAPYNPGLGGQTVKLIS